MIDYKLKYLKYKNKYLDLKNLDLKNGGSHGLVATECAKISDPKKQSCCNLYTTNTSNIVQQYINQELKKKCYNNENCVKDSQCYNEIEKKAKEKAKNLKQYNAPQQTSQSSGLLGWNFYGL
jgi:hypothetical protein